MNQKKKITGITAIASNKSIGYNNNLIFNIKDELLHFSKTTRFVSDINKKNAIIMGKNTFLSLNSKPLFNRINCVISSSLSKNDINQDVLLFKNVEACLSELMSNNLIESIFVIGGESLYKYFIDKNYFTNMVITHITYPIIDYGDKFFPEINSDSFNVSSYHCYKTKGTEILLKNEIDIEYTIYSMEKNININYFNKLLSNSLQNNDEYQYLNILRDVLNNGEIRNTRNSQVISLFSKKMDFDISQYFPLLTTKKVFFKGVKKELLWFISGNTNANLLSEQGVNIWNGNSSREYLDSIGLCNNKIGDCGPIYGYQWRHFNNPYKDCDTDYKEKGIDQLMNVINLIKTDPFSRRIYMTAWNPCQLSEMALPPCHVSYQFYVEKCTITDKLKLNCLMYQRSGDLFLGVPFNIASTALLTYIIANVTDTLPNKIRIVIGDAHIYSSHIEQIKTQLERLPYKFPELIINKKITDIDNIDENSIIIRNYKHHSQISAKMIA